MNGRSEFLFLCSLILVRHLSDRFFHPSVLFSLTDRTPNCDRCKCNDAENGHRIEGLLDAANAALEVARLNLERSTVLAPVNGIVTNFDLLPGRYVNAGAAVFALIDSDTFRVEGYFEETKLRRYRIGEDATVKLIGDSRVLSGHVESIAYGIEDQNRSTSNELLASVNPTFSWVRLAQRIPVRIKLDDVPPDLLLVAGRTATVSIGKIRWW